MEMQSLMNAWMKYSGKRWRKHGILWKEAMTRSQTKLAGNPDIIIRKAVEEDAATLKGITDAAYARYVPQLGRKPQPMTADHRKLIVENDAWLILCDDQPAGLLELVREPDCMLIYSVAIRPEYQSQGLGRRLLDWAEQETWRLGLRRIRLYTNAVMESNIALYLRLGYQENAARGLPGLNAGAHVQRPEPDTLAPGD